MGKPTRICTKCGRGIREGIKQCPNCNSNDIISKQEYRNQTVNGARYTPAKAKQSHGNTVTILLGSLVIIGFIIFIIYCMSNSSSSNEYIKVWTCAEDIVKSNLKSPSTADFPWYDESYITDLGDNRYKIRAYVDAENSFGAKLRTNFTVYLTRTTNGYKEASCYIDE